MDRTRHPPPFCIEWNMNGLTERVIQEMERLLERKLSPEEVRLLLLAGVVEEKILEEELASDVPARDAA